VNDAAAAARHAHGQLDRRFVLDTLAGWCAALAAVALLATLGFSLAARRRRAATPASVTTPAGSLVRS
jgi:hypothetical protein